MQGAPITKIEPKIAARLAKQRYHLVGDHGGVKVCHWTKQSLIADRSCYKGTFYGIESHGCMQMAPNVDTAILLAHTVGESRTLIRLPKLMMILTSYSLNPSGLIDAF